MNFTLFSSQRMTESEEMRFHQSLSKSNTGFSAEAANRNADLDLFFFSSQVCNEVSQKWDVFRSHDFLNVVAMAIAMHLSTL